MDGRTQAAAEGLARLAQTALGQLAGAERFLELWPALIATRPTKPCPLPVVACLKHLTALSTPVLSPLVDAIADAADVLEWRQSYTAADFGPAFLEAYGWTEWIGLRGPIASEEIACGILLLGPGIDYPAHAHEAEELYLPLAGTALWQRGEEDFTTRPAGEPIHHPSWMPHAMRTISEPLLAFYVWRGGDLAAKSKIVSKAPTAV